MNKSVNNKDNEVIYSPCLRFYLTPKKIIKIKIKGHLMHFLLKGSKRKRGKIQKFQNVQIVLQIERCPRTEMKNVCVQLSIM